MADNVKKIPVCLDIDDHTPFINVFWYHREDHLTDDGRPIVKDIERDFLDDFCDVIERNNVCGKLTVVPMPGGDRGDIAHGLKGYTAEQLGDWIDTVNKKLVPRFDIGPEMLTHYKVLNILNGTFDPENEVRWAAHQTRGTLTPYIARALRLIRDAGINPTGVSSPWGMGRTVEDEYRPAIATALKTELGLSYGWYYAVNGGPNPEITEPIPGFKLAGVKCTVGDKVWQSMHTPDGSEVTINKIADEYITADGQEGYVPNCIKAGKPVVMLIHWQSMYGNGTRAGLRAFDIIAQRINSIYGDICEWKTFNELAFGKK